MKVETLTSDGKVLTGAIIDHKKGTAYTYPTWIQMIFGKSLVFDRTGQKDGQPVQGTEAVTQKPVAQK